MRYLALTILFFIANYRRLFGQNDFKMHVYTRISSVIKKDCIESTEESKAAIRKCRLAQFELFCIGEYKEALTFSDLRQYPYFSFVDSLNNYSTASDYLPVSAHDFIIEKAKGNPILIINEDHHQPRHRVFAKELLRDLYKQGFKYLAVSEKQIIYPTISSLIINIYIYKPANKKALWAFLFAFDIFILIFFMGFNRSYLLQEIVS